MKTEDSHDHMCHRKYYKTQSTSAEVSFYECSVDQVSTQQSFHLLNLSRLLPFQAVMLQSFSTLTQDLVSRTSVEECVSKELVCHHFSRPSLSTTRNVHHIYHDACKFHKAILGQSLQVYLPREILVSCQLHNFLTLLELLLSILQENVQEVPSNVDHSNMLHG